MLMEIYRRVTSAYRNRGHGMARKAVGEGGVWARPSLYDADGYI
jgi:hypothetical protein